MIKNYNQYDWGINENFYIAASEALNLKIFNLFKFSNVLKFDNDFGAFTEDRSWQVKSWKENQGYFLRFLKDNKLLFEDHIIKNDEHTISPIVLNKLKEFIKKKI